MGYGPPPPTPIPIVQTTLSPIDLPELHRFIQDCDTATLADYDDKGVHLPFFLTHSTLPSTLHCLSQPQQSPTEPSPTSNLLMPD
jgi:hypothetical protein